MAHLLRLVLILALFYMSCASEESETSKTTESPKTPETKMAIAGAQETNMCTKGKRQSPINIPKLRKGMYSRSSVEFSKAYYRFHDFQVENNHGHTLKGRVDDSERLTVSGELMEGQTYVFDSFHFHWGPEGTTIGSDHHINGKTYSAEMHLVHYHQNYSNIDEAVASGNPRAVAVMGILFDLGRRRNRALDPIIESAAWLDNPEDQQEGEGINFAQLMFDGSESAYFAHYLGSLTTPGCEEVVMWNVKAHPNPISRDQVRALSWLKDHSGRALVNNWRSTRPKNGRDVEFYKVKTEVMSHNPFGFLF